MDGIRFRTLAATFVVVAFCFGACSVKAPVQVPTTPRLRSTTPGLLQAAPADAVPCPADYDGDGYTDFAVKGSNGIWYIDVAACSLPGPKETACNDSVDDDGDDVINDGCDAFGPAETNCHEKPPVDDDKDGYVNDGCPTKIAIVGTPEPTSLCNTYWDDDGDGIVDDGCASAPQCLGNDGYGGRWDFAYFGYGGATATPVPADYGSVAGPADGRADLATRDISSGKWSIDYADNGFGSWDAELPGYGFEPESVAIPADFDGDGRADLSVWGTDMGATNGHWRIDYSSNGFGVWDRPCIGCPCTAVAGDVPLVGYGSRGDTPAVGDFDGDGCADLSIKTSDGSPPAGRWFFDLAKTGFSHFEPPCDGCKNPLENYGNATWVPVIANYDPQVDRKADLGVKDPNGYWWIDYADDGFGVFNFRQSSYRGGDHKPIPGNYDTSLDASQPRQLDLSVAGGFGYWYVDIYSTDGYRGLGTDIIPGVATSSVNNPQRVLVDTTKPWIERVAISMPTRSPGRDEGGNFHESLVSPSHLKIGVRYTASVFVAPGHIGPPCPKHTCPPDCPAGMTCTLPGGRRTNSCEYAGGVAPNPDLRIPEHLHVIPNNGNGITPQAFAGTPPGEEGTSTRIRRFSFTCSQWGEFPLGFRFDDADHRRWNPDYGLEVVCSSDYPGLYGTVSVKTIEQPETSCGNKLDEDGDSLMDDGCPIAGATITVDGVPRASSNAAGFWNAPAITGGPHTVTVAKSGYSPTRAINVNLPPPPPGAAGVEPGVQIDTPLEENFFGEPQLGVARATSLHAPSDTSISGALGTPAYTTFIDYSRGRTILHTVFIPVDRIPIKMNRTPEELLPATKECPTRTQWSRLLDAAKQLEVPILINGLWLRPTGGCRAIWDPFEGYFYSSDQSWSTLPQAPLNDSTEYCYGTPGPGEACNGVLQKANQLPMLGLSGTGVHQRASIVMTDRVFTTLTNGWWLNPSTHAIIFDVQPEDYKSDFRYAAQQPPLLLRNGQVAARGLINAGYIPWDYAYARTAVGVDSSGTRMWFVIADGEGIDGGGGATSNQLGEFFKVLGASTAINFDSGESTELVLKGALGWRRINILQSENADADRIGCPACGDYSPSGRVGAYISAGP